MSGASSPANVSVVEGVEGCADLLEKLERRASLALGVLDGAGAVVPGADGRPRAEWVGEWIAERVPINDREPQVLFQGPPAEHLVRVVVLEFQRVARLRAAILNRGDAGKELRHRRVPSKWFKMVGSSGVRATRGPHSLKPAHSLDNPWGGPTGFWQAGCSKSGWSWASCAVEPL